MHQPTRWHRDPTCVPTIKSADQTHQLPDSSLMLIRTCDARDRSRTITTSSVMLTLCSQGRVQFISESDFSTQVRTPVCDSMRNLSAGAGRCLLSKSNVIDVPASLLERCPLSRQGRWVSWILKRPAAPSHDYYERVQNCVTNAGC